MKKAGIGLAIVLLATTVVSQARKVYWVTTWGGSPQLTEPRNMPPAPGFSDATVRQIVHLSLGGKAFRLHFSNAYANSPLTIEAVSIAKPAAPGKIVPESQTVVRFQGRNSVTIPAGAEIMSDSVTFSAEALSDVIVSVYVRDTSNTITGHPGSRCTTFFTTGNHVHDRELPNAVQTQHWYYLSTIDVVADAKAAAVAILGDSITDGRGSTTDENRRWPDFLARRLQANRPTQNIGVLNQGIGGNRVLNNELGPSLLARFNRDVLAQNGIKWVILFEGINDLGTKTSAKGSDPAISSVADDLIAAYAELIDRAHDHGLKIFGATITPCGESFYYSPELEVARQKVNQWIRKSGQFDAVLDFDKAMQDPANPGKLRAEVDSGDHLHLSDKGYELMAAAVDLALFKR